MITSSNSPVSQGKLPHFVVKILVFSVILYTSCQ
jgi:hypothetical protein